MNGSLYKSLTIHTYSNDTNIIWVDQGVIIFMHTRNLRSAHKYNIYIYYIIIKNIELGINYQAY